MDGWFDYMQSQTSNLTRSSKFHWICPVRSSPFDVLPDEGEAEADINLGIIRYNAPSKLTVVT